MVTFHSLAEILNLSETDEGFDTHYNFELMSKCQNIQKIYKFLEKLCSRLHLCFCHPPCLLPENLFRRIRYCHQLFRLFLLRESGVGSR